MTPPRESYSGPHIERLRRWAEARDLTVDAYDGNQREPGHVVVCAPGARSVVIQRTSKDNCDIAAMYLINALALLGVDVP